MFARRHRFLLVLAAISGPVLCAPAAEPVRTAFTYQGMLSSGGELFDGTVDLTFTLFDVPTDGTPLATVNVSGVAVSEGIFSTEIDFGSAFTGNRSWIEIVANGTTLSPRQELTATPYALYAAASPGSTFWHAGSTNGDINYGLAGRVGIGTNSPTTKLHVVGGIRSDSGAITVSNPNNATATVSLSWLNDTPRIRVGGSGVGASNGFDFQKSGDASLMRLTNSGRVGIGTTTPSESLHVVGSARVDSGDFVCANPNNPLATVSLSWLNDTPRIRVGGSGLGTTNGLDFQKSGDVSVMRLTGSGLVGIGTTTPTDTLHVLGTTRIGGPVDTFATRLIVGNGTDVGPASGGFVVIGDPAMSNLGIDTNEIMARSNGAPSDLLLNADGGNVGIGTASPDAPLHVKTAGLPDLAGEGYDFVALFENNADEDADGIAIKIRNGHTTRFNNFVTFFDAADNVIGRIEGFDLENGDWEPPAVFDDLEVAFDVDFDDGSWPDVCASGLCGGSLPSFGDPPITLDGLPSRNEWEELIGWCLQNNPQGFLPVDPVAIATITLKASVTKELLDEGIVYGSKGADYAEWLPKANPSDRFQLGQIVGVRNGHVSLDTVGADQIMAISHKPAVLGNQPPAGETDNYVAVAFMGQTKVVVRGVVKSGDYIVASAKGDGVGIAVSPDALTLDQVDGVLGRAWSDSSNGVISLINVSVGLSTREWAGLMASQEAEIANQRDALADRRAEMEELEARLGRLEAALSQMTE